MNESSEQREEAKPQLETVADRLERLEKALANIADGSKMERDLAERVFARLKDYEDSRKPALPEGLAAGGARILSSTLMKALLPAGHDTTEESQPPQKFGILREFQLMIRMYFDARYRVSRVAQFAVPAILLVMVLNYLTFAFWSVPILAPLFERMVLIILVVTLYKILAREAARYDEVLRYFAKYRI